jgi:aspartyl-tRNA(Asn)/glutamyl-tRNA(Gln) amidotransferase subunit C
MTKQEKTEIRAEPISDGVIAEVVDLARLDPDDPAMSEQKGHLKRILEHFQVLSRVDVEGVDPTIHVNPTPIPLRADEVGESLSPEEALPNAHNRAQEFFQAPQIFGGEESDHL